MPVAASVGIFALASGAILVLGIRLTRNAQTIATGSRHGRGWVGFILLAMVTSLPEAIAGISSVTVYAVPNIAVGDVVGSLQFNLLILAVAAALLRPPAVAEARWDRIACWVLVGLTGVLGLALLFAANLSLVAGMGLTTPLLLLAHPTLARYQARKATGVELAWPQ